MAKDESEYAQIIRYAKFLDKRERLEEWMNSRFWGRSVPFQEEYQLERELKNIINRIIESNSEETIPRFADYRNYMTYEILITNDV